MDNRLRDAGHGGFASSASASFGVPHHAIFHLICCSIVFAASAGHLKRANRPSNLIFSSFKIPAKIRLLTQDSSKVRNSSHHDSKLSFDIQIPGFSVLGTTLFAVYEHQFSNKDLHSSVDSYT